MISDKVQKIIFAIVISASFVWHFSNRNNHFQEMDSEMTWNAVHDFDSYFDEYEKWSYPKQNLWHIQYRKKLIEKFKIFPEVTSGFYKLPYATTYTPGMGLLYSLISPANKDYESYLERGVILNLVIFHFSAILLFLIVQSLFKNTVASVLTALCFLFSVSHYSYGYHLGSTNWFVFTGFLWVAAYFDYQKNERPARFVFLSAICMILNYLIALYILSGFICDLVSSLRDKKLKKIMLAYLPIGVIALTVLVLFFPLEESRRGFNDSVSSVLDSIYHIVLNFFAWSRHLAGLQFAVFGVLLSIGGFLAFKNLKNKTNLLVALSLAVFLSLVALDKLALVASRHILYLSPIYFIVLATSLHWLLTKGEKFAKSFALLPIVILPLAAWCLYARSIETADPLRNLQSEEEAIILRGTRQGPYIPGNLKNKKILRLEPYRPRIDLEYGKKYLYLSQTDPLDPWAQWYVQSHPAKLVVENVIYRDSDVYFSAFNSRRYPYTRQNGLFMATFRVERP